MLNEHVHPASLGVVELPIGATQPVTIPPVATTLVATTLVATDPVVIIVANQPILEVVIAASVVAALKAGVKAEVTVVVDAAIPGEIFKFEVVQMPVVARVPSVPRQRMLRHGNKV